MAKNVINSVSYPKEMQKFLDENPDLSLSKIVQSKIIEIQNTRQIYTDEFLRKDKHIRILQRKLLDATDEIERLKFSKDVFNNKIEK